MGELSLFLTGMNQALTWMFNFELKMTSLNHHLYGLTPLKLNLKSNQEILQRLYTEIPEAFQRYE